MMFGIYATKPRSRKYQWLIVLACLGDSIVRVVSLGFLGTRWEMDAYGKAIRAEIAEAKRKRDASVV